MKTAIGALVTGAALGLATQSYATFAYGLKTDGSGAITTGGSWSGDGTIQSNVDPDWTSGGAQITSLITGTSGGTLQLDDWKMQGDRILDPSFSYTHQISFGSGTGTISLIDANNFDNGDDAWSGIRFTDLVGVDQITINTTTSSPLSSRTGQLGQTNTKPYITGISWGGEAASPTQSGTSGSYDYGSLFYAETDGGSVMFPGLPNGAATAAVVPAGFSTTAEGSFEWEFDVAGTDWLAVRGFDWNGNDDVNLSDGAEDLRNIYSSQLTTTLFAPSGDVFDSSVLFDMSHDGQQFDNWDIVVIPEPSSALMIVVAVCFGLFSRRR